jgi:hypothetical protein
MLENSPSIRPGKQSGAPPGELSRLGEQDLVLDYMIRHGHPLTWNSYVAINWGAEPPVENMDEVETQVRDYFMRRA